MGKLVGAGVLAVIALLGVACSSAERSCDAYVAKFNDQCKDEKPIPTDVCAYWGSDSDDIGCGSEFADFFDGLASPEVDVCKGTANFFKDPAFEACLKKSCPAHENSSLICSAWDPT